MERIGELQTFVDEYWRSGHILANDRELLTWQHPRESDRDHLSVLVADSDGEMAGTLGVIPTGFCLRGERTTTSWMSMWLASPKSRKQRTGLLLLRQLIGSGQGTVATLGANPLSLGIYRGLGFSTVPGIHRWVRVCSEASFRRFAENRPSPLPEDCLSAVIKTSQQQAPGTSKQVRLREWNAGIEKCWDEAWKHRFAPRLWGTWRDAEYIRWRYVNHPRFHYRVLVAEQQGQGEPTGLLVYRVETIMGRQDRLIRVVEFLSDETSGPALATAVVEAGEHAEATFADFYCSGTQWAEPLESAGFVRQDSLPAALPGLFHPLDWGDHQLALAFYVPTEFGVSSDEIVQGPDSYITRSDCDQDRPN